MSTVRPREGHAGTQPSTQRLAASSRALTTPQVLFLEFADPPVTVAAEPPAMTRDHPPRSAPAFDRVVAAPLAVAQAAPPPAAASADSELADLPVPVQASSIEPPGVNRPKIG